jgi:phage terminase large subunit-like protein
MSDMLDQLSANVDFEMGRKDFKYFFEEVCGKYDKKNPWILTKFHQEWFDLSENTNKTCIIASRDHGKSVFYRVYLLWKMAYNPGTEVLFFSHSQHQSIEHMGKMNELIESIPALQHLKPKRGWAKQKFKFTNKSSISAMSVGKAVRGAHPDIVVLDDILSSEAQTQLKHISSWFYTALLPVLHHTAQLCIVGTPFSYTDLYAELKKLKSYAVREYPAINEQTGEPLFPERWSLEALNNRRNDMTSIAFTREYLCKPIASEASLFPEEVLERVKDDELSLSYYPHDGDEYNYYIGWDPAISADRRADYTCMMVIAVDKDRKKHIIHTHHEKGMDFSAQIDKIIELNARFNPVIIELETNNFAIAFNQVLNEISDLPIKPFNMSRMKKEALIHTLQLQFEQGNLLIPYKDEGGTRRLMNTLLTELSTFTMLDNGRMESLGGHDDMVMALALSVQATKEYRDNIVILDAEVWQSRLGWANV